MRLDTSQHMKMDMRLRMAPRMIQSMEILQLPLMALQERIDQELSENPVLVDLREAPAPGAGPGGGGRAGGRGPRGGRRGAARVAPGDAHGRVRRRGGRGRRRRLAGDV